MPRSAHSRHEFLIAIFEWAEERTLTTIDWYLWRKTGRARWSKFFRALAILFGICGGLLPLLHAAYPAGPAPEWGFVLLAASGGFVLGDRIFGFTSSWMRFMHTQAELQAALGRAQAQFLAWRAGAGAGDDVSAEDLASIIGLVEALIDSTTKIVLNETSLWADDLVTQMEDARTQLAPTLSEQRASRAHLPGNSSEVG